MAKSCSLPSAFDRWLSPLRKVLVFMHPLKMTNLCTPEALEKGGVVCSFRFFPVGIVKSSLVHFGPLSFLKQFRSAANEALYRVLFSFRSYNTHANDVIHGTFFEKNFLHMFGSFSTSANKQHKAGNWHQLEFCQGRMMQFIWWGQHCRHFCK